MWEDEIAMPREEPNGGDRQFASTRMHQRVHCGIAFDRVRLIKMQGINRHEKNRILNLLTIRPEEDGPMPGLWMGTVKNAAVNALTLALAAETLSAPVRVNTLCIHFGVAPAGGRRNQLGVDAEKDTLALAPAFLGVASGQRRGEVICLDTWADVEELSG
jgi:NAD(P)-dependent dehydrogenase (short-subunit alcohol dehydrogenase family)